MKKEKEDRALKKAVADLPVFSPEEGLWEQIETELEEEKPAKGRRRNYMRWAAILLLPLVAGGLYLTIGFGASQLDYTEETIPEWPLTQLITPDNDFSVFLQEECQPGRDICENPEFKLLMTELQEVSDEFNTMVTMIDESGMDEFLVKARSRLEKEEVRLKRKIVELLKG